MIESDTNIFKLEIDAYGSDVPELDKKELFVGNQRSVIQAANADTNDNVVEPFICPAI